MAKRTKITGADIFEINAFKKIAQLFGNTKKTKRSGRYSYWENGKRINDRISPN